MKISELIEHLQQSLQKHGDLEIACFDEDYYRYYRLIDPPDIYELVEEEKPALDGDILLREDEHGEKFLTIF